MNPVRSHFLRLDVRTVVLCCFSFFCRWPYFVAGFRTTAVPLRDMERSFLIGCIRLGAIAGNAAALSRGRKNV